VTVEVTPLLVVLVMFPPMSNAWVTVEVGVTMIFGSRLASFCNDNVRYWPVYVCSAKSYLRHSAGARSAEREWERANRPGCSGYGKLGK
jgi:hypothetical protein